MRLTEQNYKKSSAWVTRCPECKIAFRITLQHLKAADGSVRCGNCLHVFKAMQNLVSSKPRPFDLGPQDLHSQDQYSRESYPRPTSKKSNVSQQEKSVPHPPSRRVTGASIARKTNTRVRVERGRSRPAPREEKLVDPQYQPVPRKKSPPKDPLVAVAHEPLGLHFRGKKQSFIQARLNRDSLWRNGSTFRRSLISASIITLMLLLFGQYVAFNVNTPSSVARATAMQFCDIFGCRLPKLIDQRKIQINNIIVRNDPDYVNGLIVDAIITNKASFAQPYPALWMIAKSSNGDIVGSRQLTPAQYLAGEASGETDMPPENPVHLSLKILKPQDNAHNISFTFAE